MEKTDKHSFYIISSTMPAFKEYLDINSLPIVRKINITNKSNSRTGGIELEIEERNSINLYDILSNGVLFFTDISDANNMLMLIKRNGYKNAFLIKVDISAEYKTLENDNN